jgi:hypothetical protein
MRLLSPIFEANNVDVVFSGHVHNYQRSFPLTFVAKPQPDGSQIGPKGEVAGDWKLDQTFGDGAAAKPHGVIYIVSGAGGAELYNPEQQTDPASWQPFTNKFFSEQNSLSVVDIDGKTFRLKQISATGKELASLEAKKGGGAHADHRSHSNAREHRRPRQRQFHHAEQLAVCHAHRDCGFPHRFVDAAYTYDGVPQNGQQGVENKGQNGSMFSNAANQWHREQEAE